MSEVKLYALVAYSRGVEAEVIELITSSKQYAVNLGKLIGRREFRQPKIRTPTSEEVEVYLALGNKKDW